MTSREEVLRQLTFGARVAEEEGDELVSRCLVKSE